MEQLLPQKLRQLAKNCPFPLYVVGGTCRDYWAGLVPSGFDFDIASPTLPDEFCEYAQANGFIVQSVYHQTGTVKLTCDGVGYEYACFRSDKYIRGEHTPTQTYFTQDIELDARRRDFCCNAIYYNIATGQFVDPLGGIQDAQRHILRTVRDPERVFGEDGLRLLRMVRQSACCGFEPDKACLQGVKNNAHLIRDIVPERIGAEVIAILQADQKYGVKDAPYHGLCLLRESGLLPYILPELALGDGMEQNATYHRHDVLEHTFRAVRYSSPDVRLSALLHDCGKPYCWQTQGNFYEHEVYGERIARQICGSLRVSKRQTDEVCRLVRWHMYDLLGNTKENKIRKLIVENLDIFPQLLALKQADYSACRDDLSPSPIVLRWQAIYQRMVEENCPLTTKDLAIKGNELIAQGISPNLVGKLLHQLLIECVYDPKINQKERLLKRAVSLASGAI